MNQSQPAPSSVLIKAKRVDADEAIETVVAVDSMGSEAAIREQLTRLVHARYPDAEFRSFADSAATYLAPKLLVVAIYRSAGELERRTSPSDEQQQLFAA